MYADDCNIFVRGTDIEYLVTELNVALRKISQWFAANHLALNVGKTNYMVFSNKVHRRTCECCKICGRQNLS